MENLKIEENALEPGSVDQAHIAQQSTNVSQPLDSSTSVPLAQLFAEDEKPVLDISPAGMTSPLSVGEVKLEDVGGDVEIKEDDVGRPLLNRLPSLKAVKREPILWNHVPSAREEAALAFQELEGCIYQSGQLGSTGQEEIMGCDCKADVGPDGVNYACGEESDCINRLTSIECTDDECNCGARCANQRFQLREYADVDVFHAGKKGYGLRALVDLEKDMFVYEYIGEVINERRFRQRQKEYEEQQEKHFYFMMLQKGEYIDATRKGGFGRFINHSCEPNCYVDKWVVGDKLRMGIFTKKAIVKGEELSFDYNVDRYGGDATPCYCGEPTCLGYIGGKTQTEAANKLPQSVVEALGIDDGDDWDDAKPKNARRRKKGQDDEEYVNELTPREIKEKDVPKIMASLLQTTERWLLRKLLQRISENANHSIQSKIVALHGYQTLGSKLEKWKHDAEISILILGVLQKWPTITKNKISSSKIETHIKAFVDDEQVSTEVKELSSKLLETWSTLEMAYRIPRRVRPAKPETTSEQIESDLKEREKEKDVQASQEKTERRVDSATPSRDIPSRPRGPRNPSYRQGQHWRRPDYPPRAKDTNRSYNGSSTPQSARPGSSVQTNSSHPPTPVKIDPINHDLQAIIDAATKKQQEQAAALKLQEEQNAIEEAARLEAEAKKRAERTKRHEEHKANKEKRVAEKKHSQQSKGHKSEKDRSGNGSISSKKAEVGEKAASSPATTEAQKKFEHMLAKFVPNVVAKYQDKLGKDQVKKRAKEIVKALVAKEIKKESPDLVELSDHKKAKIKLYAREFMDKVVSRADKGTNSTTEEAKSKEKKSVAEVDQSEVVVTEDSPDPDSTTEPTPSTPQGEANGSTNGVKRLNTEPDNQESRAKQVKIA